MKTLYRLLFVFSFFSIQMPTFAIAITGDTATNITFYSAKLNGIVNPSGIPTAVSFELGTDLTYGYTIVATPDSIEGFDPVAFETEIKGIAAGTTYHFRVKTVNSQGTIYGDDKTFTTVATPANNFTFSAKRSISKVGVYTDIAANGLIIPVSNYDNCNSAPVNIGFDFYFSGATFSQFILNTNGFIKLGNVWPADSVQFFNSPIGWGPDMGGIFSSPHFADVFLLSPFNHDLQAGTNPPEFRVFTEGTTGNRVCTIQFKNLQEKEEPPYRQFNNIEFQICLYEITNVIEFKYGTWQFSNNPTLERSAAIGIKGSGNTDNQFITVSTWYPYKWNEVDFYEFNYIPEWYPFYFGQAPNPNPVPGSMFIFSPKQVHDATVSSIQTMGKLPIPFGLPHTPATYIQNTGYDTLTNIVVNMTISGSNTFSGTKTIALLKPDSGTVVEFPGFDPSVKGYNTINVTISNDDFMQDNTKLFVQKICDDAYHYCDSMPVWFAYGFSWGSTPGSPGGLWLAKYHINGVKNIRAAKIGLGGGTGQNIYAVVLNSSGLVVAQSANYSLTDEHSWQYHTFDFPNPPVIANDNFYIGLAQTESPDAYFPMGFQTEEPNRRNAFYTAPLGGGNITESVGGSGRYSIEAVLDSGYCMPTYAYACNPNYHNINSVSTTEGTTNISNLNTGCTGNANNYTFYPEQIVTVEQGAFFNFRVEGGFALGNLDIWADWNGDGDFLDANELAFSIGPLNAQVITGTINVPATSATGNTRLRFIAHNSPPANSCGVFSLGETEDYSLLIQQATPMTYQTGTTFQCDTLAQVSIGSINNQVIGIKMKTVGVLDTLSITSFNLNSGESTDFMHDVSQVKVFYSGNDSVFSTDNLFGSATDLSSPIAGNTKLSYGTNYFWVAFDIHATGTPGNFVDAACLGYTITGAGELVPVVSSPPGKLMINYCIPEFLFPGSCADYGVEDFSTSGGVLNISNLNSGCPPNLNDYSRFTEQIVSAFQGDQFQFSSSAIGGSESFLLIYADWNKDYDFGETNELVYSNYGNNLSGTITVPVDAVAGSTRLRLISYFEQNKGITSGGAGCQYINGGGETEDYTMMVLPGSPMAYQSGTVFQCDTLPPATRGSTNNRITGIKINVSGNLDPISLTSINLTSEGSTAFSHDVLQVKIFYTGHDSVFLTNQLFGSAIDLSNPISGNVVLQKGANFFWVCYDIKDTASIEHYLDASCTGYTISESGIRTPDVISPFGKNIIDYCIPYFTYPGYWQSGGGISGFSTTGGIINISNLNNGYPANTKDYTKYPNHVITVQQGSSFQYNIVGAGRMALYIDWNQDYIFNSTTERVSSNYLTGAILVPADAVLGITRFRVISYQFTMGIIAACGGRLRGETEDYLINILPAPPTKTLNLTAFLEGLYPETGGVSMTKSRNANGEQFMGTTADLLTVELHDAASPYALAAGPYTANLNTDGSVSVTLPASFGASYYIVVKHRNSLQTWSAAPVSFASNTIAYNFSTAATAAYGNNLKQNGSLFLIYCGDVNQDGIVNSLDQAEIETAAVGFAMGYLTTDVNGDGVVDALDLVMTDNNAARFVSLKKP